MKVGLSVSGLYQLKALRKKIEQFPVAADTAGAAAANEVVEQVEIEAARDITQELNLPASYIREKFLSRKAKRLGDVAIVAARKRAVRAARYAAEQITAPAPRAKGDALRGIQAGRKQAGVSIKVKRAGKRTKIADGFLLPLRAGKQDGGNGFGIFTRLGDVVEQEYRVSPDQAFRAWIAKHRPDIGGRLAVAFRAHFARELRKLRK